MSLRNWVIADVIEAMAGVVRREFLVGFEVDAKQIANGVAILHSVQTADSHATGIWILRMSLEHSGLDPRLELLLFLGVRLRFFRRRHDSRPHILQHLQPEFVVQQGIGRLQFVEGDLAFPGAVTVTVVAILREERLNVFAELGDRRCFSAASQARQ